MLDNSNNMSSTATFFSRSSEDTGFSHVLSPIADFCPQRSTACQQTARQDNNENVLYSVTVSFMSFLPAFMASLDDSLQWPQLKSLASLLDKPDCVKYRSIGCIDIDACTSNKEPPKHNFEIAHVGAKRYANAILQGQPITQGPARNL